MSEFCEVVADARNRKDWLEWRKKLITASDVYKVLRGPESKSYQRLAAEKRGDIKPDDLSRNPKVMAGSHLEEGIANFWGEWYGYEVEMAQELCRSRAYPFLGATPDAFAHSDITGRSGIVEVKFTNVAYFREADGGVELERLNLDYALSLWRNGPPPNYRMQHDTQMFVLGKSRGWIIASLGGGLPLSFPRSFGDESRVSYEQRVIPQLEQFARDARII